MAPERQSRPDDGLDFEVGILKTFERVPSSLGSGCTTFELALHVTAGQANALQTLHKMNAVPRQTAGGGSSLWGRHM